MSANGTRNETRCREVTSKDGTYSGRINKEVATKLKVVAGIMDTNKTSLINDCISKAMDSYMASFSVNELALFINNSKDKEARELATDILVKKTIEEGYKNETV